MKKSILLLVTIAALAPCLPVATNAATQVYDLKTDWSDTQNPNGTWSYRQGYSLLSNNPFSWVGGGYDWPLPAFYWPPAVTAMEKVAGPVKAYGGVLWAYPGYLEDGDVLVVPGIGGNVVWTAPTSGTINISGTAWLGDITVGSFTYCVDEPWTVTSWTLTHNGSFLSSGGVGFPLCGSGYEENPRGSPYDFSSGTGGAAALHNIPVATGDQIALVFSGTPVGVNFTITLTPASVDPVAAIEDLATTVVEMNLQNGIENSLDSKLDAAVNALVDANFNNDGAACNSLAAFINAVEAQRGKKIPSAQADQLIAAAQEIQAMLNCGN